MPSQSFTYEQAQTAVFQLEQLLKRWSIAIVPGSQLETAALSVIDLVGRRLSPESVDWLVDLRPDAANLVGLNDLAVHLVRVAEHPDFGQIVPHLRLLNQGQAVQNRSAQSTDQAANKLFELLVACWIMATGATEVRVDDPHRSKGDNPDVMFTFRACRWGVACKALHSRAPQTIFGNLHEGIRQIETCQAERGMVLLNVKNLIAHDQYLRLASSEQCRPTKEPLYQTLARSEPHRMLKAEVDALLAAVRDTIDPDEMIDAFLNTKTIPALVVWAHTTSAVGLNGRPTLMSTPLLTVGQLSYLPNGPLSLRRTDLELLSQLNDAANISPRPNS